MDPGPAARPAGVTALGAALMLAGAVGVLGAAYILFETVRNVDSSGKFQTPGWDGWETLATVFALFVAAVATLTLLSGRGILAGRRWARQMALIAACIGGAWAAALVVGGLVFEPDMQVLYALTGLVPCALVAWCLLRRDVARWFRESMRPQAEGAHGRASAA